MNFMYAGDDTAGPDKCDTSVHLYFIPIIFTVVSIHRHDNGIEQQSSHLNGSRIVAIMKSVELH